MTEIKKSILRRKLDAENPSSSSTTNMPFLWEPIGKASVKILRSVLGMELVLQGTRLDKCCFEEMKKNLGGKVPVFEFSAGGEQASGFLYFSSNLSTAVTSKKLGDQAEKIDVESSLSLLDLYLLDPTARHLLTVVDRSISEIDTSGIFSDLAFTARSLSLENLHNIDDEADFIQITFAIGEPLLGGESQKETAFSVTYCFLYPLFERLSLQASSRSEEVLDFDNPWTKHMHAAVLSTEVSVAAVLENCTMSIAECTRFEVGQVINLPGSSLDMLTLKLKTRDGCQNLAFSALGVVKQYKAVKLLEDPAKSFLSDMVIAPSL